MFYRACIFENVNVSRFSKVKTQLKLCKGHRSCLFQVRLFPLGFLCHLTRSAHDKNLLCLRHTLPYPQFFLYHKRQNTVSTDGVGLSWSIFSPLRKGSAAYGCARQYVALTEGAGTNGKFLFFPLHWVASIRITKALVTSDISRNKKWGLGWPREALLLPLFLCKSKSSPRL